MEQNDKILAASPAELILLIDSSAFIGMRNIAAAKGAHPINLLNRYPKIDYFFSNSVANEFARGKEGFSPDTFNMIKKSLQDEAVSLDDKAKDNRHLYEAKDGKVKVAELTKISAVDYGQILLCQNHKQLVLLTNDHNMLKNAAALLDRRVMDVQNLLELMSETPDPELQRIWQEMLSWHKSESGYRRPKTVRTIPDRKPGELPKHFRE